MEDCGRDHGIGNCWQPVTIKIFGLVFSCVDCSRRIDEFLNGDVSIPSLSIEVTGLRRRVFHTTSISWSGNVRDGRFGKQEMFLTKMGYNWDQQNEASDVMTSLSSRGLKDVQGLSGVINGNIVSSMRLVDSDFSLSPSFKSETWGLDPSFLRICLPSPPYSTNAGQYALLI